MIAVVTSIGEKTTGICCWALARNGFNVKLIKSDKTTLFDKLKYIYNNINEDFVRVDADVVVNKNFNENAIKIITAKHQDVWWFQFLTYDWFKQDVAHGGVQFIKKEALVDLKTNIDVYEKAERPESQMYRIDSFCEPIRRAITIELVAGLNGYGQTQADIDRVIKTKIRRKQINNYDIELMTRLNKLV